MIKPAEEFTLEIRNSSHQNRVIADWITVRDAEIRAEAREQHRQEVVVEINEQNAYGLNFEDVGRNLHGLAIYITDLLKMKSLKPDKPEIPQQVTDLVEDFFALPAETTEESKDQLAILIASRVATWKESK